MAADPSTRRPPGFLSGFEAHLGEPAIGSIGEIFDTDPPFASGGCIALVWSARTRPLHEARLSQQRDRDMDDLVLAPHA